MRMRILIGASVLVIAGVGVTYLYLKNKKNISEEVSGESSKNDKIISTAINSSMKDSVESEQEELFCKKESISTSIQNRHTEAAVQMRESLTNILDQESVKVTENTKEFDKMISDLDRLMDDGEQKHE